MLKQIIKKSPEIVQKPIGYIYYSIPDYIRYGKVFRETYRLLEKSQYWNRKQLEQYQINQLQKLITHAYETVPYYKKVFNEYGIRPKEIQDFTDFKKIPYLTKEIIQNNINDLISNKYNKQNLQYTTTGGSTGIPMGFYVDKKYDKAREWAFIAHMWSRVGYDINKTNKCVILRGNVPKSGIYEYKNRDLILSSYCLTEERMKQYSLFINKFNPDFIQAYPSSISILSDYIINNNIRLNIKNLKAIICASENLYDFQREKIQKAFGVRVYSFYGHTEHACIGGECEKGTYYHLQSEYGYTEILTKNGEDITEKDGIGEIVATGFNNYVVPFIRYKTKDLAVNTNEICSCGRSYRLIKKLQGREQEQLITSNGAKIAMTSIIFAQHFEAFGKIKMMQLEQNEIGKVILKIVKKEAFNNDDLNEIICKMEAASNNTIKVEIKFVDNIERTKLGKYKFLIQNLKV